MTRRRYLYSGRVQGVGFRVTAADIARRYPLTGTVRNLNDGRVELIAQGAPGEIDAFAVEVSAAFSGKIQSIDRVDLDGPDPDLAGFHIRY